MKVGQNIDLAHDPRTQGYGVGGTGVVTVVKQTDPVNNRGLVIIRTPGMFLHLQGVELTDPPRSKR
jgi:hypothetical protein